MILYNKSNQRLNITFLFGINIWVSIATTHCNCHKLSLIVARDKFEPESSSSHESSSSQVKFSFFLVRLFLIAECENNVPEVQGQRDSTVFSVCLFFTADYDSLFLHKFGSQLLLHTTETEVPCQQQNMKVYIKYKNHSSTSSCCSHRDPIQKK